MSADLVERLESAAVGSRDLDLELWPLLTGDEVGRFGQYGPYYVSPDNAYIYLPAVTTSIDAALLLAERALAGCEWEMIKLDSGCTVHLGDPNMCWDGEAATPALALCAAVLRARQPEKGEEG